MNDDDDDDDDDDDVIQPMVTITMAMMSRMNPNDSSECRMIENNPCHCFVSLRRLASATVESLQFNERKDMTIGI